MVPRGFTHGWAARAPVGTGALLLAMAAAAAAGPATGGVALVFGNGNYSGLPPLQACVASAHAVAAALRRLDFAVVEREDASAGEMDGALSAFTAEIRQHGRPPTVIYACGYGTGFNHRSFLLPVSAVISRPADVLTQGLLTRSVLATVGEAAAGPSVAVLDVAPMPHGEPDLGLAALIQADLPSPLGVFAATETTPSGLTPTPVANALIAALEAPGQVAVQGVLLAENNAIGGQAAVHVAALHAPAAPEDLIGAPPMPAPVQPRPAATRPAPAAPAAAIRPAPATGAAAPSLPGEDHMTESDRREVQSALARLGYYDGRIDGIFGPDTRAAIRRWQFELHVPMTGQITAAEADRLVGR